MKSRYYYKNPSFLADITQRLDEVVMLLDCVATKKFQSFFFYYVEGDIVPNDINFYSILNFICNKIYLRRHRSRVCSPKFLIS